MAAEEYSAQVRLRWIGLDDLKTQPINHVLLQLGPNEDASAPDEIYLTVGHAVPPFVDVNEPPAAGEVLEMPIRASARFVVTRQRLAAIVQALQRTIDQYDAATSPKETS